MASIINMTPHDIHLVDDDSNVVRTFKASGNLIRLSMTTVDANVPALKGIVPTTQTVYGDAVGLPDYAKGTFYLVSQLVKTALPNRVDLLVPAQVVRDDKGRIVGCKSFGV